MSKSLKSLEIYPSGELTSLTVHEHAPLISWYVFFFFFFFLFFFFYCHFFFYKKNYYYEYMYI